MDIKYMSQKADEPACRSLFVAIDLAAHWVYLRIHSDQSEVSGTTFLWRLRAASSIQIVELLTRNGSQFTDRFTSKRRNHRAGMLSIGSACCSTLSTA